MKLKACVMRRTVGNLAISLVLTCGFLTAGEGRESEASHGGTREEIALLKIQLAAQQQQIQQLRRELDEQKILLRLALHETGKAAEFHGSAVSAEAGQPARVASLAPVVPAPAPSGAGIAATPIVRQAAGSAENHAPLSFSLGSVHITPVGYAELVAYVRDRNVGSGLGTNYAGIPFSNTANGNLSEANLTAQSSRLGFSLDTKVAGMGLRTYVETDFLGASPGNVAVNANSNTLRLRLFWVNLTRNKFELLAGQSWSLLTPNRKGISALPPEIFRTLSLDPYNHVGLVWARDPQFRLVYHPNSTVTVAASLESPSQYVGGSAGAGVITFPTALAPSYGNQLNTGTNVFGSPSPVPDFIGKLALDHTVGGRAVHLDVAGLLRRFAVYNPLTQISYGATGGGGSVNGNIEVVKNFRLFASTFYSDGGGRYIFGMGPDLIVRGDGSLSLVRAYSTVDGFEAVAGRRATVFGYYGGAYFQQNAAIDPLTGKPIGYGYQGSPSNHNRTIQQITFGLSYVFWRKPEFGGLSLIPQYSYLFRDPWDPAPGQPRDAHVSVIYLALRYLLPGAVPGPK